MSPPTPNTSWRAHLFFGLLVGAWLAVFLVIVGPFDAAELPLHIRVLLLPPYGLLFLIAYLLTIGIQNWLFARLGRWNWWLEGLILFLTYAGSLLLSFAYYKTDIIRGDYSFANFVGAVYLPTVLLVSFLLLAGRWYLSRRQAPVPDVLSLSGTGQKDLLQLAPAQLVYATSAQNYVEVVYLADGELKKHLLRTTLKDLEKQVDLLLRIHRSHLINPQHFRRWLEAGRLEVHTVALPVSKQYRPEVKSRLSTHP
ncbi:MAG: LytTR family DNA-binding domain-containing protein [Bacteroidota bacterium]